MVVIVVKDTERTGDEARSLMQWLAVEDDLRGRVRLLERPSAAGELGGIVDGVEVALAAGGTGLASVLVAWVKTRVGYLRVRVERPDGGVVELTTSGVRGLDADGVRAQVHELGEFFAVDPVPAADESQPAGSSPTSAG